MASMVVFLVVVWLTDNLTWSAAIGMAFGVAQIGWQLLRRRPIEALQWLSLVQILAAGTATLLTDNATFMMLKPSVLSVVPRRGDAEARLDEPLHLARHRQPGR